MKINPKHNKAVAKAVHEARKVIVQQTIELLKLIDAKVGDDVVFDKPLVMFENRKNGSLRTIVADRISYFEREETPSKFYLVEYKGEYSSSDLMSLSSMKKVYDEVYKIVRKH